jgi:hypothetical protein
MSSLLYLGHRAEAGRLGGEEVLATVETLERVAESGRLFRPRGPAGHRPTS